MKFEFLLVPSLILAVSCRQNPSDNTSQTNQTGKTMYVNDVHSYANPNEAVVNHLDLTLKVDFDSSTLSGVARWTINEKSDASKIIFDSKGLNIKNITLNSGKEETPAKYNLGSYDSILGSPIIIETTPACKTVNIYYSTSPGAEALQWLKPVQTAGKKYPYLLTQSQAILARTWIPCQDSPGIRFSYDAHITVPNDLIALMSANNPQEKNATGDYSFVQKIPIPSYLMALAVGDIAFKNIGRNTGVYAEPVMLDKCADEFSDMQKMMDAAEKLYGTYRWGRYDVIVLPPSFPFGGMENPELTFATPTIIAGDKSLVSLVAHEMAHSWSGNLVTNATWNDFWLNEGFTVYFENRIMEAVYGKDYADMLSLINYTEMKETVNDLGDTSADTDLKLNLAGRNPDDGVTNIAYDKGFYFLRLLESKVGREKWDAFLKGWFDSNAFQSRTTEYFLDYLHKNLIAENESAFAGIDDDINKWVYGPGIPTDCPQIVSEKFNQTDAELKKFNGGAAASQLNTSGWAYQQWVYFIKNLPATISLDRMKELDNAYHFTQSGNSEILMVWFTLCVNKQYKDAYPQIQNYLITIGRRRLVLPIYKGLIQTPDGDKLALEIYAQARPGYHFVTQSTLDELLGWNK